MRRYGVYFGLFVLMLVNYIDRINMSVAIGPLAKEFDLTPVAIGYLFSVAVWSYALLLVPFGIAVDRWGVRMVTAGSATVWSLAGMLTGAATSFPVLLLSRLVLGAGECSTYPSGGRIIRDWAPKAERGFASAFLNSGAYAGPAVGILLVAWLVTDFGWRASFYVTGLIGFAFAAAFFMLYRDPEKAAWLSDAERALILRERDHAQERRQAETSAWRRLRRLLAGRTIWALFLIEMCVTYTWSLFVTWMPSYLQAATGVTLLKTGVFAAMPFVVATLCVLLLGWLSDRGARLVGGPDRRILLATMLVLSAVILLAPLASSTPLILLLVTVSLTCVATAISLNVTLTNDLLTDGSYAGLALGFVILGGNLAGLIAPIVTGYVVQRTGGYFDAFVVSAVLMFVGALISLLFLGRPIVIEEDIPLARAKLSH